MPPSERVGRVSTLTATCWSCDRTVSKRVASRNRNHRHLAWTCERCDVQWIGPGVDFEERAAS